MKNLTKHTSNLMQKKKFTICYYISDHGLGHAARATQVIHHLPKYFNVIVKTTVKPSFIIKESKRSHIKIIEESWDVGLNQSDNRTIDWEQSVSAAVGKESENQKRILSEADFLKKNSVDLVITDIAAAPLKVACEANIPGIFVGNFTWIEIFASREKDFPQLTELLAFWKECYNSATVSVKVSPAFSMSYLSNSIETPPMGRQGKSIELKLKEYLRVTETKIVLLYMGNFGNEQINIPKLQDITFVSFIPMGSAVNFLDPNKWNFPDVLRSCDAVLAKPGYGVVTEAMANQIPLIYYPRTEFPEYSILSAALKAWNGSVEIPNDDLQNGLWEKYLTVAFDITPDYVACDGTAHIMRNIMQQIKKE